MKIYIDHFAAEEDIAKDLILRIRALSVNVTVTGYYEIRKKSHQANYKAIRKEIKDSDVIIPLITPKYLLSMVHSELQKVSSAESKYLFPFICSPSNWSSMSWIVKSKVFPFGGIPFSDLDEKSREVELNSLVQTISDIINSNSIVLTGKQKEERLVFISHDHDDADFAELLKLQLEKSGVTGWIDSERLKIGQDWRQEIDDGISNAVAVIAIMTPDARKSEYVTYEWAYAWGKGKKIFPIMLKQTPLHPRLESLQYLDFTNRVTRPWDKLIESILELTKK